MHSISNLKSMTSIKAPRYFEEEGHFMIELLLGAISKLPIEIFKLGVK